MARPPMDDATRSAVIGDNAGFDEICVVCGGQFTLDEWDDRHSTYTGEDCHADCCPLCQAHDERDALDGFAPDIDTFEHDEDPADWDAYRDGMR